MKSVTARALHRILSHTRREDILDILDAIDAHSLASAQLGINAQVAAITKTEEAIEKAIENIRPYYRHDLEKDIQELAQ